MNPDSHTVMHLERSAQGAMAHTRINDKSFMEGMTTFCAGRRCRDANMLEWMIVTGAWKTISLVYQMA